MPSTRRYLLLGGGGFVGRAIHQTLRRAGADVLAPSRDQWDLLRPETFDSIEVEERTVIDCATRADGSAEAIEAANHQGLERWVDRWQRRTGGGRYVYFSTAGTHLVPAAEHSAYLTSKAAAERYIAQRVADRLIVRLSFPFGIGENPNRLISRLIARIVGGQTLSLDPVTLTLTPIEFLCDHVAALVEHRDHTSIDFSDGSSWSLQSIAHLLFEAMGRPPQFDVSDGQPTDLTVKPTLTWRNRHDIAERLCAMAKAACR